MKKIKCIRCGKEINLFKDRFTHIEDWKGELLESESWWHLKCFKESLNKPETELVKMTRNLLNKAKTVYDNMPEHLTKKKEEEYIVE